MGFDDIPVDWRFQNTFLLNEEVSMGFDHTHIEWRRFFNGFCLMTLFVGMKKLAIERSLWSTSVNSKLWLLFFVCRRVGASELVKGKSQEWRRSTTGRDWCYYSWLTCSLVVRQLFLSALTLVCTMQEATLQIACCSSVQSQNKFRNWWSSVMICWSFWKWMDGSCRGTTAIKCKFELLLSTWVWSQRMLFCPRWP